MKCLTNTDVPARLAHFCVLHQHFEVERPKGRGTSKVIYFQLQDNIDM